MSPVRVSKTDWIVSILLLVSALSPHVVREFHFRGTAFDTDEGHQVVTARNYSKLRSFVAPEANTDLSKPPEMVEKTNWPLTYSWLLIVITKTGVSWTVALLLFSYLLLLLATAGWFALCLRLLNSPIVSALVVGFLLHRISMSPADLVVCAASPLLLIILSNSLGPGRHLTSAKLAVASILVAIVVIFKYSAWYFIPGVGVVLLSGWRGFALQRRTIIRITLLIVPAAILALVLLSSRDLPQLITDRPIVEEQEEVSSRPSILRMGSLAAETFFTTTFRADYPIRLSITPLASFSGLHWRLVYYLVNWLVILCITVPLYRYYRGLDQDDFVRSLIKATLGLGLAAALFLISFDYFRGEVGHVRTYRYYSPVAAALIVIYAKLVLDNLRSTTAKKLQAAMVLLLLGPPLVAFSGQESLRYLRQSDIKAARGLSFVSEVTEQIRKTEPAAYMSHVRTTALIDLPVANLPEWEDSFWDELYTSRPAWLFLIRHQDATSKRYVQTIDSLEHHLDLEMVEWEGWQVFYRRFDNSEPLLKSRTLSPDN